MQKKLRVVLAQLNLMVGDIAGNTLKHIAAAYRARDEFSADIIVFSELSLTGYPPEDLLLRQNFIQESEFALQKCLSDIQGIYCIIGHPNQIKHQLFNTCSVIYNGKIIAQYAKQHLPNHGVFDEARYFTAGDRSCVLSIHDVAIGLQICEDIWATDAQLSSHSNDADLVMVLNASPFEKDKHEKRLSLLTKLARNQNANIIYVNQIGGQDELIFDGGSMVMDATGNLAQFAGFFNETLLVVDIEFNGTVTNRTACITRIKNLCETNITQEASVNERIYSALVLALRDYTHKNNFRGVLLGLSGGIDSALTLAIAVDALGKENVHPVLLPSRYSSDMSIIDAEKLIATLNLAKTSISIEPIYKTCIESLTPFFADKTTDVTEENLQARIRANVLMALSNKFGYLVLTTGNRSEIAVGYCTLYGDMAGGFAPLKDVTKTEVYALARYRNGLEPIIPERIIERAPSAELAFDQKDEDSLPPYPVLDKILQAYLNEKLSIDQIVHRGFHLEMVTKIVSLIHKSEYKRAQSAVGPHINHTSFGKDWRYPITSGFKD